MYIYRVLAKATYMYIEGHCALFLSVCALYAPCFEDSAHLSLHVLYYATETIPSKVAQVTYMYVY